jgi:hypothetical protein
MRLLTLLGSSAALSGVQVALERVIASRKRERIRLAEFDLLIVLVDRVRHMVIAELNTACHYC